MLADETASLSDVAAAIGRTETWLRRNWLRLAAEQGFPRKLPCGWVWPRDMVVVWIRSGGAAPAEQPPASNDNGSSDPMAAFRATLSNRYGVSND